MTPAANGTDERLDAVLEELTAMRTELAAVRCLLTDRPLISIAPAQADPMTHSAACWPPQIESPIVITSKPAFEIPTTATVDHVADAAKAKRRRRNADPADVIE